MSDNTCTVTGMFVYPIKACQGSSLTAASLSPSGIAGDRQLMVVADGAMLNQKRAAQLATVKPELGTDGAITLSAPDMRELRHRPSTHGPRVPTNYYADQMDLVDQGDEIAEWISTVVKREARIVALPSAYQRSFPIDVFSAIDGQTQNGFPDVAPVLLTNEASLADLNSRLTESVGMERFRPNVIVKGLATYQEDSVARLQGSAIAFGAVARCERCAVTATDQLTGQRGSEPLATLKTYRQHDGGYAGGIAFGAYMSVSGSGELRVGDALEISLS